MCNTQASFSNLFVGQLALDRHILNGSLHGILDLFEHLLDLDGQMTPPRMHMCTHRRNGNEHCYDKRLRTFVCITFLALQVHILLEVSSAAVIALENFCS